MNTQLKKKLEEIYRRYGFEVAKVYDADQVIVFTLKAGYFDNADIIPLSENSSLSRAFTEFSSLGFACTKRDYHFAAQAEHQLFKGFFSVTSILERLNKDYAKFTSNIVKPFSDDARYEYINAPYYINGRKGENSPAEEIVGRLSEEKPILFLIEAAAGFGKTCTAYEIVRLLIHKGDYLPLFSELSRNRKAPIFRYVLLDEIDHKFPSLNSKLVQAEMVNGRVITILDGFDELLRKADDTDEFKNQEPMLETIGQFLSGAAKIVLTTRRTVLFEGDAFHTWAATHADDFELVRIRIGEPSINDWLPEARLSTLNKTDLSIQGIANPVLLSYLRCIPDVEFEKVAKSPQLLVDKYFKFMLERERIRQDLQMDTETQKYILTKVCEDMISFGYTSEQRDYIVDLIMRSCSRVLDRSLLLYPTAERPNKEFVANKIASHALLDRNSQEETKIGFVNEFVFGYFVAENIFKQEEWLNDDLRFLEPAVVSCQPRSIEDKRIFLEKIGTSLEFVPISDRIDLTAKLTGAINFPLSDEEAEGLEMEGLLIGDKPIANFQFNGCIFRNCQFNLNNFSEVSFLECRFYGENVAHGIPAGAIYILGDVGDSTFLKSAIEASSAAKAPPEHNEELACERHVLEKFWPIGRDMVAFKHRPISVLCSTAGEFKPDDIYKAIVSLKKRGLLVQPNLASFVELNFDYFSEIKTILER